MEARLRCVLALGLGLIGVVSCIPVDDSGDGGSCQPMAASTQGATSAALHVEGSAGFANAANGSAVAGGASSQPERYIVVFDDLFAGLAQLRGAGGTAALTLGRRSAVAAYLPSAAVENMRSNANVRLIEKDPRRELFSQGIPYGIAMTQLDLLDDGLAGVVSVCVIDSGLDAAHEDIEANRITASPDASTGDPFVDLCGHGTHVAGTIAALNNERGVVGALPGGRVHLHIVKVFGDDCNWSYASSLIAAIDACVADAPTDRVVINMSLGGSYESSFEATALAEIVATGRVLPVAAAGNAGTNAKSYPASYESVISVAAVDSAGERASFSQTNEAVELAAPGVLVRSTMDTASSLFGQSAMLTSASRSLPAVPMYGTGDGDVIAPWVDCGFATSVCQNAVGKVCKIDRGGGISFATKVQNCQAGGGLGAVIVNNTSGELWGSLAGATTLIPSAGLSQHSGKLLEEGATTVTLSVSSDAPYAAISGTSMATPHIAGAAALLWSHFPALTNTEIRDALNAAALDLGDAGRDDRYGYGLVQTRDAVALLGGACQTDGDCDDGNACTGAEACVEGRCIGGQPIVCDDGNPCTEDVCVADGECSHTALSDGAICSDDDFCAGLDRCHGGVCIAAPAVPDGTSCEDDNLCNGAETCQSGQCQPAAPPQCISDVCNPTFGCQACVPSGTECSSNEQCCSGSCDTVSKRCC